ECQWTDWIDVSYPKSSDRNGGDYETFENIVKSDPSWVCEKVENISCRAKKFPHIPFEDLGQEVECSVERGLICNNSDQKIGGIIPMPVCLNYEIRVCCSWYGPTCTPGTTTSTTTTSTVPTPTPTTTTSTTTPPPSTTSTPKTTTSVPTPSTPTPTTISTTPT
ncbi:MUC5A protein, partial [Syrrhaptes paradoxus]|nr:MUC5A protein [Syrrhaptes paradoxus]